MFKHSIHPNTRFTDQASADHYIEIDEGPFSGACFNISRVEFMGEDEEGNGRITFDYTLFYLPEQLLHEDIQMELESAVADILNDIIVNSLEKTTNQENNENRNTDIDEFDA